MTILKHVYLPKRLYVRFMKRSVMGGSGDVNDTCIWVRIGASVGSDRSGLGEGLGRHGAWVGMGCGDIVCICEKRGKG